MNTRVLFFLCISSLIAACAPSTEKEGNRWKEISVEEVYQGVSTDILSYKPVEISPGISMGKSVIQIKSGPEVQAFTLTYQEGFSPERFKIVWMHFQKTRSDFPAPAFPVIIPVE